MSRATAASSSSVPSGRAAAVVTRVLAGRGVASRVRPACCAATTAPPAMSPQARTANLIRVTNMVLSAPSINRATVAGTAPAVVAPAPAAIGPAARTVASTRPAGTAAEADRAGVATVVFIKAIAGATPRRTKRARNRSRPLVSRLFTVPIGQLRCRAACSWVRPSRSQSTTGDAAALRQPVDLLVQQSAIRPSSLAPGTRSGRLSAARRSCARRRAALPRARTAIRRATRCSQGPSESSTQSERDRCTSTRNVAWNASSTSLGSLRTFWPIRRTIGPCRSIRAAKASSAASPPAVANRSRSWPSVSSPMTPRLNSVRTCRRISPSDRLAMDRTPRLTALAPFYRDNTHRGAGGSNFSGIPAIGEGGLRMRRRAIDRRCHRCASQIPGGARRST